MGGNRVENSAPKGEAVGTVEKAGKVWEEFSQSVYGENAKGSYPSQKMDERTPQTDSRKQQVNEKQIRPDESAGANSDTPDALLKSATYRDHRVASNFLHSMNLLNDLSSSGSEQWAKDIITKVNTTDQGSLNTAAAILEKNYGVGVERDAKGNATKLSYHEQCDPVFNAAEMKSVMQSWNPYAITLVGVGKPLISALCRADKMLGPSVSVDMGGDKVNVNARWRFDSWSADRVAVAPLEKVELPPVKDLIFSKNPQHGETSISKDFPQNGTQSVDRVETLVAWSDRSGKENNEVTRLKLDGKTHSIDNVALQLLNRLPNLVALDAKLYGKDDDFKYLAGNPKLETLVLDSFVMGSKALSHISELPNLKKLDLSQTYAGQKDMSRLTSESLEELRMGFYTKNESLDHIAKLPNLKVLQLDLSQSKAEDLKALAVSKSLKRIIINQPHEIKPQDLKKIQASLPGVQVDLIPSPLDEPSRS